MPRSSGTPSPTPTWEPPTAPDSGDVSVAQRYVRHLAPGGRFVVATWDTGEVWVLDHSADPADPQAYLRALKIKRAQV